MAEFTMSLGEVMQTYALNKKYADRSIELWKIKADEKFMPPDEVIDLGREFIFDFDYDLPIKNHKKELEIKMLRHYFYREICVDMPLQFKFYFRNTFMELLPYYSKMYSAVYKDYDFLENYNINVYETKDETTNDNGYTTSDTNITDNINKDETKAFNETTNEDSSSSTDKREVEIGSITQNNSKTNNVNDEINANTETNSTDSNETDATKNYDKNSNSSELLKMSDTPQNDLSGIIENKYLTRVDQNNRNNTEDYEETTNSKSKGEVQTNTESNTTQETTNETTENNKQNTNNDRNTKDNEIANVKGSTNNSETNKYETTENINNANESHNVNQKDLSSTKHKAHSGLFNTDKSKLLKSYLQAIRNVDLEFINAMNDCFMNLYE